MFVALLWDNPRFYVAWLVVVTFSICVHEFMHAWTASLQGDYTAREHGYMSLNPLRVMGPSALVCLVMFGIAWGSVPVNPRRMRRHYSHALVAFAGPAANLGVAVVAVAAARVAAMAGNEAVFFTTGIAVQANVFLLLFNLLPVPILDGWEVWSFVMPPLRRIPADRARQAGLIILLVILLSGLIRYVWELAFTVSHFLLPVFIR
jgi:Zn-dependent protease